MAIEGKHEGVSNRMALNINQLRSMLRLDGFARSTHYDPEWMLAKEFGVQVCANDLWISATDNFRRNPTSGLSTPWPGGVSIGNKPVW